MSYTLNPGWSQGQVLTSIVADRGCRNTAQLISAFRSEDQIVAVMPYHRSDDFRVSQGLLFNAREAKLQQYTVASSCFTNTSIHRTCANTFGAFSGHSTILTNGASYIVM
jgi:hypothetical protein